MQLDPFTTDPKEYKRWSERMARPENRFLKKLGGEATLQEEAEEKNTWGAWFSNLWSSLTSDDHLPKRFRQFIKQYGRTKITKLQMLRQPVGTAGMVSVQVLTAGSWDEYRKKAGIDSVYHTSLVINGDLIVEKTEKLEGRKDASYPHGKGTELFDVALDKELTIAEFLENGRKKMGKAFYSYDFLKNNCQSFVMSMVQANGLLTPEGHRFIKQDLDALVKELPIFTKHAGVALTDTARNVTNVGEELLYKRGGKTEMFSHGGMRKLKKFVC